MKLNSYSYDEKLNILGLTTHKLRRKRGDLIQLYKIINNLENDNLLNELRPTDSVNLRGHNLRIHREKILTTTQEPVSLPIE